MVASPWAPMPWSALRAPWWSHTIAKETLWAEGQPRTERTRPRNELTTSSFSIIDSGKRVHEFTTNREGRRLGRKTSGKGTSLMGYLFKNLEKSLGYSQNFKPFLTELTKLNVSFKWKWERWSCTWSWLTSNGSFIFVPLIFCGPIGLWGCICYREIACFGRESTLAQTPLKSESRMTSECIYYVWHKSQQQLGSEPHLGREVRTVASEEIWMRRVYGVIRLQEPG